MRALIVCITLLFALLTCAPLVSSTLTDGICAIVQVNKANNSVMQK